MKPFHWVNSAGGDFTDAADWSGGAVPGAGDDAFIDALGTYTVTLSSAEAVRSLILNDAGATFALGTGANLTVGMNLILKTGTFRLGDGATISGGTVRDKGGKFLWQNGTLDGVTYDGPLNMRHHHSGLFIGPNDLVLTGAEGTGPGTANLSRASVLIFRGTQTFNNATVNLNGSSLSGDTNGSGSVLTLGKNITINDTAGFSSISGSAIVNQGTINASADAGNRLLFVNAVGFSNDGKIVISNGDKFEIDTSGFTNLVGGTLTGGVYDVGFGSKLQLDQRMTVVTDDAVIILNGRGSAFDGENSSFQEVPIESTLTAIGAEGLLKIIGGRGWASTQTITNAGALVLQGGTFAAGALTNDGVIRGRGVFDVAITGGGTITAVNGRLDLRQAISGAGALEIDAAANLKVEASAAASLTTTFNGVGGGLVLGDAAEFAATIAGFAAGDTIDLLGQAADSATLQAGDQLVVKNGTRTIATLQLTGDYGGATFAVASDGRGGSNITTTAGLFAQAMSSMAGGPAHTGPIVVDWRPHPPMLASPRMMFA